MVEPKYLYLIMPSIPSDGLYVWSSFSGNGFGAGNIANGAYVTPLTTTPPPFVFYRSSERAHQEAASLSKLHGQAYYVTEIKIKGNYAPPPPEWYPALEATS